MSFPELKGRAPHELEWTPPKLMQEVLARRRNRPSLWEGELEVREFPLDACEEPGDITDEFVLA